MSETKCAYCGMSAESEGHERKAIGGDGPMAHLILQTCPSVPKFPGYAIAPMRGLTAPPAPPAPPTRASRIAAAMKAMGLGGAAIAKGFMAEAEKIVPSTRYVKSQAPQYMTDEMWASRDPKAMPIVYDKDCPFDYEHEAGGVLLVGNKERATHRALHIESVEGETFKQRVVTVPLEFPNTPGVPKPDFEWPRDVNARPVSNAEDDMRKRGEMNRRRGILKHGPFGSGEAGPCDPGCAKCRADAASMIEKFAPDLYLSAQREERIPDLSAAAKAFASEEWSDRLRLQVAEAKRRDAEAARYTPYWSPEEQQGGDL